VKCQPYNQDKDDRSSDEIKAKFDSLFEILEITDDPPVPKEDVEKLKNEVFGYNTFWVTGTEELGPEIMGEGILIKVGGLYKLNPVKSS
jgi:hypothetical protein